MGNYDKRGNKKQPPRIPIKMPCNYFFGVHLPSDYRDWMPIVEEFVKLNPRINIVYLKPLDFQVFITTYAANRIKPWIIEVGTKIIQVLPHKHVPSRYMWGNIE